MSLCPRLLNKHHPKLLTLRPREYWFLILAWIVAIQENLPLLSIHVSPYSEQPLFVDRVIYKHIFNSLFVLSYGSDCAQQITVINLSLLNIRCLDSVFENLKSIIRVSSVKTWYLISSDPHELLPFFYKISSKRILVIPVFDQTLWFWGKLFVIENVSSNL